MYSIKKMPTVLCPKCNSKITFTQKELEEIDVEGEEKGMGASVTYTCRFDTCCPKCGQEHYYKFCFTEYPVGVLEDDVFYKESSADVIDDVIVEILLQ